MNNSDDNKKKQKIFHRPKKTDVRKCSFLLTLPVQESIRERVLINDFISPLIIRSSSASDVRISFYANLLFKLGDFLSRQRVS